MSDDVFCSYAIFENVLVGASALFLRERDRSPCACDLAAISAFLPVIGLAILGSFDNPFVLANCKSI
jgi:hypothetical protein